MTTGETAGDAALVDVDERVDVFRDVPGTAETTLTGSDGDAALDDDDAAFGGVALETAF